jgi:hypothetical protein
VNTVWSRLIFISLLLIAAIISMLGITWGLPSRAVDPYLFGDREPWTGQQILELTGQATNSSKGADVDLNPLRNRGQPVVVNDTDAQRAEIVRRYRLYSYQPDEMQTLMAIASMRPGAGDLDPKMYKYGGLWVYPVAVLLKLSSIAGWITLKPDLAFYLDHPEAFGRFYVVMRAYVAMWMVIGAAAVWWIALRMSSAVLVSSAAVLCFIFLPVVVTPGHEAKPHLPGVVLILLVVIAATKFVESGTTRWWVSAAALCGAAVGMVLSALPVLLILPAMAFFRPAARSERFKLAFMSVAIAMIVYAITNPYVLINLFLNRELLASHFGNSADFYEVGLSFDAIGNSFRLIILSMSPVLAIAGITGTIGMLVTAKKRKAMGGDFTVATLLAIPSVAALVQFIFVAKGQPSDFARFALLPSVALAIAGTAGVASLMKKFNVQAGLAVISCVATIPSGVLYLRGFISDTHPITSRLEAANKIEGPVYLSDEPAPFSCPSVNLFDQQIIVLPRNRTPTVYPIDGRTPISWAHKRFYVQQAGTVRNPIFP